MTKKQTVKQQQTKQAQDSSEQLSSMTAEPKKSKWFVSITTPEQRAAILERVAKGERVVDIAPTVGLTPKYIYKMIGKSRNGSIEKEARRQAVNDLAGQIKRVTQVCFDNWRRFDNLFRLDIRRVQASIKALDDAIGTMTMGTERDKMIKERDRLLRQRNDLIYRSGINQQQLASTLKPLGVTTDTPVKSDENSLTVNVLQIFDQKDGRSHVEIAMDRAAEMAKYLEGKRNGGKEKTAVEVL